jgi:hypothetical protein
MTQTIAAAIQTELDKFTWIERDGIAFDLGTVYAFWTGIAPYTWNSILFNPGASLLKVSPIEYTDELVSQDFTVELRAIPETAITPDVLATIETYPYRGAPVTIYRFFFHPDTGAALDNPIVLRQGYCERIEHQQDGETYKLVAFIASKAFDLQRAGVRVRTTSDQHLINATDNAMRHVAKAHTEKLFWGSNPPARHKDVVVGRHVDRPERERGQ